tara:strand:+ start:69 stop:386 length:318 start_codon:yes stop_codon:yes gene_type:complete
MSVITRFLNGDVSLPKSFWLIATLLGIPINLMVFWIASVQPILGAAVFVIWVGFCIIGVWRSSNKYTGKKVWAILTKVLLVVWVVQTIFMIYGLFTVGSLLSTLG